MSYFNKIRYAKFYYNRTHLALVDNMNYHIGYILVPENILFLREYHCKKYFALENANLRARQCLRQVEQKGVTAFSRSSSGHSL